jgi:hypothetical protein
LNKWSLMILITAVFVTMAVTLYLTTPPNLRQESLLGYALILIMWAGAIVKIGRRIE